MREVNLSRKTGETAVELTLNFDGSGKAHIRSGNGFFDHMLELFAAHGGFDLQLQCQGDIEVDFHHSCEDIGITLGRAFDQALRDRAGIKRYGWIILPMDEALLVVAADISGRGMLCFDAELCGERCGEFETQLVKEFWLAFCREAGITLHIRKLAGENTHHIIEGIFKAAARALGAAVSIDHKNADKIPSTKGTIQ